MQNNKTRYISHTIFPHEGDHLLLLLTTDYLYLKVSNSGKKLIEASLSFLKGEEPTKALEPCQKKIPFKQLSFFIFSPEKNALEVRFNTEPKCLLSRKHLQFTPNANKQSYLAPSIEDFFTQTQRILGCPISEQMRFKNLPQNKSFISPWILWYFFSPIIFFLNYAVAEKRNSNLEDGTYLLTSMISLAAIFALLMFTIRSKWPKTRGYGYPIDSHFPLDS